MSVFVGILLAALVISSILGWMAWDFTRADSLDVARHFLDQNERLWNELQRQDKAIQELQSHNALEGGSVDILRTQVRDLDAALRLRVTDSTGAHGFAEPEGYLASRANFWPALDGSWSPPTPTATIQDTIQARIEELRAQEEPK